MAAVTPKELIEKIVKARLTGKTFKDIAKEVSLPVKKVIRILEKTGVRLSPEVRNRNCHAHCSFSDEDVSRVIEYRRQLKTIPEISTEVGLDYEQVRYILRKNNIKLDEASVKGNIVKGVKGSWERLSEEGYRSRCSKIKEVKKELWSSKTKEELAQWAESKLTLWETYSEQKKEEILSGGDWWKSQIKDRTGFSTAQERYEYLAKEKGGELISKYEKAHLKMEFKCSKGHIFLCAPHNIAHGSWCPICTRTGPSKAQKEIFELINSWGVQCELSDRTVIKPLEIDILCPNEKLAFEYNGLYWHSYAVKGNTGRHAKKKKALFAAGYALFAIFDDEWDSNRLLIENMLKRRLGKFEGKKLNARDMVVEAIELHEASEFFKRHHLDGAAPASKFFGLRHLGELVACASLRKNFVGEFELGRFATHMDCIVRGAAGKLIKAVRTATGAEPLVSYSNNRLSDGDMYKKLGFEFVRDNPSSYWYTDGRVRVWRWKCKKDNSPEALAKGSTEQAQAEAGAFSQKLFGDDRPLFKIEDYGHKKWILR